MSIQSTKNYLDTFERDAGICQYCDEDLLWSYSIFESAKFDLIEGRQGFVRKTAESALTP